MADICRHGHVEYIIGQLTKGQKLDLVRGRGRGRLKKNLVRIDPPGQPSIRPNWDPPFLCHGMITSSKN